VRLPTFSVRRSDVEVGRPWSTCNGVANLGPSSRLAQIDVASVDIGSKGMSLREATRSLRQGLVHLDHGPPAASPRQPRGADARFTVDGDMDRGHRGNWRRPRTTATVVASRLHRVLLTDRHECHGGTDGAQRIVRRPSAKHRVTDCAAAAHAEWPPRPCLIRHTGGRVSTMRLRRIVTAFTPSPYDALPSSHEPPPSSASCSARRRLHRMGADAGDTLRARGKESKDTPRTALFT
jgi:hypothetical protein